MAPLLPQADPSPRADALAQAREHYRYTYDVYPSLALAADLPRAERAQKAWSDVVNAALVEVVKNNLRADRSLGSWAALPARFEDFTLALKDLLRCKLREGKNDLVALLLAGRVTGPANHINDYTRFFQTIPVPDLAATLHDDIAFARRTLAGANPEILERLTDLDDLPITDAMLALTSPGDTLEAALAEHRLFQADYAMLEGLPPNDLGGGPRYVFAPRALFVVPPGPGVHRDGAARGLEPRHPWFRPRALRIFAVRVRREPKAPVFTPAHGWGWEIAKIHVAVADTIAGAIWFHHARTHLVAEPMILAARRQLAPNHPLLALIVPHAEGTLSINHVGARSVFGPHGLLDWFAGTSREGIRELSRRSVHSFRFDQSIFPRRLALRGVADTSVLPDFPFRDDGLLLWNVLHSWIRAYVELYYTDEADVLEDVELQGWVREIGAPDGGGILGVGDPGGIRTRGGLIDMLTQMIFSGSAIHAAMNFPVATEMAYVPNSPFGAWGAAPTHTEGWTEADWRALLPPLDAAQRQFDTALLLGLSRYGHLGSYPDFADPRVAPLLAVHRSRLADVEAEIERRNTTRRPYVHLQPSRVPMSINI